MLSEGKPLLADRSIFIRHDNFRINQSKMTSYSAIEFCDFDVEDFEHFCEGPVLAQCLAKLRNMVFEPEAKADLETADYSQSYFLNKRSQKIFSLSSYARAKLYSGNQESCQTVVLGETIEEGIIGLNAANFTLIREDVEYWWNLAWKDAPEFMGALSLDDLRNIRLALNFSAKQ